MKSFWKQKKVIDKKHLAWIRKQVCWFCGASASDVLTITPHHVGDGITRKRSRDDLTVPACVGLTNDKKKPMGCHRYVEDNRGAYDVEMLRKVAKSYWDANEIEKENKK